MLAISGGIDSVVLLELLTELGVDVAVAHCNFGLRGGESDGDEQFVIEKALEKNIRYFTKRIHLESGSIQLEARERRYEWFGELKEKHGFNKLSTAHHLNDSLETTLLNLTRGTGIHGLGGIPIQSGWIIRPLMFAQREEIEAYAKHCNVSWREDSSNQKADYTRNKIRLDVVPNLRSINNSLESTFLTTKERLDLLSDFLKFKAKQILKEEFSELEGRLNLGWIQEEHDLILLNEILAPYGFNYPTVKEIFEARDRPGKLFKSPGFHLLIDRESLYIKESNLLPAEEVMVSGLGIYEFADYKFEISVEKGVVSKKNWRETSADVAYLSKEKLSFPLKMRIWEEGDVFQPLGMQGTKKVSDFLIDQKVPLAKKDKVVVLESGGHITWVVGSRISEKFKMEEDDNSVVIRILRP